MKSNSLVLALILGVSQMMGLFAADAPNPKSSEADAMMNSFLKREAMRMDAEFLAGITSREQWEARRPELHQQYMEMLGLWPLPEKTPLDAQVTGVLERSEGFRVEKLHFQSRPHLYVTANLYLPKDARAGAKLPGVLVDPPASHRAGPIFPNVL